jgi:hypothetical protein
MKAIVKPPRGHYYGNLLWNASEVSESATLIQNSLENFRRLGYYASPFPEGDGVAFGDETKKKKDAEIVGDLRACFEWLDISVDLTFSLQERSRNSPAPSFGHEESILLSKAHIALAQLEDAIELFIKGNRISSITLAGAADGIFSGLLKQKGILSPAEKTWASVEEARRSTGLSFGGERSKRDAFNEWNSTRNKLKHHDDKDEEQIEVNVFDEAYYAIQRANADAEKLGLKARNRQEYENWLIENVFM